jgi:putative monooxygenase
MAEAHILRIDSLPVIDRGNGIQTIPLVTKELGSKHLTTGITRFPVGAMVPMHSHNCDEQVTILEGEAKPISTAYATDSTLMTRLSFQQISRTAL